MQYNFYSKFNRNKFSNGYLTAILIYLIINCFILYKWVTFDYDNNYTGAIAAQLYGFSNLIINIIFFMSFIIAGIAQKDKRKLYFLTAFFAFVPVGILIITG